MSVIKIEWLSDDHDCDTCGYNYAQGAKVFFDDELALDLTPHSACYDGDHWTDSQIYQLILEKLGHTVVDEENF